MLVAVVIVVVGVLLVLLVLSLRGRYSSWSVRSVRVVELALNEREALRLIERTLESFDLTDGPIRRRKPQAMEVTMRADRRAFGDNVEVRTERLGPAKTRVEITSNPVMPRLWDWGRSRSIANRIAADLVAGSA